MDELAATARAGVPGARPRRSGVRLVLPRHHPDPRAVRPPARVAAGRPRSARRGADASIRCGRSRGPSPGRSRGSTCPAGTGSGMRSRRIGRRTARPGWTRSRGSPRDWPFLSSLLDNAEMSLAKADMGVARLYAALATGPGDDRRWDAIETEYRRTGRAARPGHRARAAARRRRRSSSARSRCATRTWIRSRSCRSACWPGSVALAARRSRSGPRVLRLVQLTVNGVAAGLQSTG